jgi:thioredoxin 1
LLLEFGAAWCGICEAAQRNIRAALAAFDERAVLQHIKVADGHGKPLGRSFRVKLWPTLIVLREGKELGRVVRPTSQEEITRLLDAALHVASM